MSGPNEQQTAAPDGLKETVVERATTQGGIWDQTWGWFEAHWLDLMTGVPAIIATIFLVEITKEWIKLLGARWLKDSYTDKIENMLIRTWTVPCAFVWVAVLGFTKSWNQMTGMELVWWQGWLLGTTITTGCALGLVWLIDYLNVAPTLRVRFQRLTGVSKDDIAAARTTRGHASITAEQVAADRKKKGLDEPEQ